MHKIFGFIPLKPDWTREEWLTHYRERHGPLVAGTGSFARYFSGYAQNYALENIQQEGVVGVSELWLRDIDALADAFADPAYQQHVRPDEDVFTDQSQVRGGVGEQIMLRDYDGTGEKGWARQPLFKIFVMHWPNAGVPVDAYRTEWKSYAASHAQSCSDEIRAFGLTVPDDLLSPTLEGVGIIEEYWFDTGETAQTMARELCGQRKGAPFVDTKRNEVIVARHHRVFGA